MRQWLTQAASLCQHNKMVNICTDHVLYDCNKGLSETTTRLTETTKALSQTIKGLSLTTEVLTMTTLTQTMERNLKLMLTLTSSPWGENTFGQQK